MSSTRKAPLRVSTTMEGQITGYPVVRGAIGAPRGWHPRRNKQCLDTIDFYPLDRG